MKDLIERQAAIDEWKNDFKGYVNALNIPRDDYNGIMAYIDELPSAQPEIIHCKDCIWYELPSHKITENCVRWMKSNGILLPIKPDDFCSRAERKR